MTSRAARFSLVVFLLLVGIAGAYVVVDGYHRYVGAISLARARGARIDAMVAATNELALTQRGYFEPSRDSASSLQFQRVRQLSDQLKQELNVLRSSMAASGPEMLEQIEAFATALDDFTTTDTRVRTNLANDTLFSAADLVFSTSSADVRAMTEALTALKTLAEEPVESAQATLRRNALAAAGAVAFVWIVGLILLGWTTGRTGSSDRASTESAAASHTAGDLQTDPSSSPPPSEPVTMATALGNTAPQGTLDLETIAAVCGAMARATSATDLREIMADAASCLDAHGMIIWLGAGEELFPVLGHGYDPRMLARIGPLSRQASNATSTAWRTTEQQVVPADAGRPGAIVVPIVSGGGCIGVLSAEIRGERERNVDLRAGMLVLAAQLSTIVAAWPEPSAVDEQSKNSEPGSIAATL